MVQIFNARQTGGIKPVFSWKLRGDENQRIYRIQVSGEKGNTVWDSGNVESDERHNIPCPIQLEKEQKYNWSIYVMGEKSGEDTAEGDAFLTEISKWEAKWMEPDRIRKPIIDSTQPVQPKGRCERPQDGLEKLDEAVYMRKTFLLQECPKSALLYAASHGIYSIWVNGHQVSDLFAPGNTSYKKHIDYQIYDVAKYLQHGKNVICVVLADGWYTGKIGAVGIGQQFGSENAILFQLSVIGQNGTKETIMSDEDMKWSDGAIRYADLYVGEYYDANYEKEGWLETDYDDHSWRPVRVNPDGYEQLVRQSIPAIRETRMIRPTVLQTPKGELLLDAGENIVGYTSFELTLNKGDIISLEHSETIDKDGNYIQNIIGQNKNQTDYYVAKDAGNHCFKPQFSFHGFRYVRVKGTTDTDPSHYQIHVIETPLRDTGTFRCSDERLNKLQENILRSQKGNLISIPTDCPQRERTGWTGDMQVYARTGCYEQDIEMFLRHWLRDMEHEQLPDGQIPHIVPYMPSHDIMKPPGLEGVSAAGWSDAAVIVPWRLYEAYGDKQILRECFPMMKRYMDATKRMAAERPEGYDEMSPDRQKWQKYLWNTGFQYGDWLMPSIQMSGRSIFEVVTETGYIIASVYYALTTDIMRQVCMALGETKLEKEYEDLNTKIREAFAKEYINEDGTMKKDYQGVYVTALAAGCVPEEKKKAALDRLETLIQENDNRLDTGFLSVPYLLPVLHKNGRKELANTLLFQDKCPSWLYEVKMGATTMWEYWNGYAEDGTPSDCSMNHFAFGCVGEYLYRTILGITPLTPGYQEVLIQPDTTCGLNFVEGSFETIWGTIEVSWKLDGKKVKLNLTVPPDVTAKVVLNDYIKTVGCGTYHIETCQ